MRVHGRLKLSIPEQGKIARSVVCAVLVLQQRISLDLPYPTLEGVKTILNEMGRTRPEVLKYDAASMIDPSLIKAIDDEGFLKKLK